MRNMQQRRAKCSASRASRVARTRGFVVPNAATAPPVPSVIPKEELIELSRKYVTAAPGELTDENTAILSDDFVFRGPLVGPLLKKEFVTALNTFKSWKAFPDLRSNAFGFDTDPDDPMRVWFFYKTIGTMSEDWNFAGSVLKATGKPVQNGVEAASYIWTPDRKIKYMSVGYCVDRINGSTPNGSMNVAVAGLLRAADSENIWKFIRNPVLNWVQDRVRALQGKPARGTAWEDLPEWFKQLPDSKLKGDEGYH